MFREKYYSMNEQITPDQKLVDKIINSIDETKRETNKRRIVYRQSIIVFAVFIVLVFAAMPVLAGNIPVVYEIIYSISPSIAQRFIPVKKSCENDGIKMEVISAYIHGNTAEIYIAMRDLGRAY